MLTLKTNSAPSKLTIKVVENEEERLKAFLIRGIVYIHEQSCPYNEEFDRNDFTSTQLLGEIDGEPVLTARIRYFGRFAKLERLAIRKEYRGRGYGHELLKFMISFCVKKGFNDLYLHAQRRLQPFYESYGFGRIGGDFSFSDHDYVEMYGSFAISGSHEEALDIEHTPLVLNRPEGRWHEPGPMEKSLPEFQPETEIEEEVV